MSPTVGRIVHFRLTAEQAESVNARRRADSVSGNRVGEGSVVPLIITAVWPEEYTGGRLAGHPESVRYESAVGVNGQAILDGVDSLWVCSAPHDSGLPGCWFWPPRT